MAFSSRSRHSDGRESEFGRGGQSHSQSAYYPNNDQNHHDYSNLPNARPRNSHEGYRDETRSFNNNNEGSNQHHTGRSEEGPSSPLEREDAPSFQGRGRREEGGENWQPSTSSFDQQREELVRRRSLYEDKEFLPVTASIYYSRQHHRSIQWMRPGRICGNHRPFFVQGGFERFDIKQGALGDCWFVAAMACVCGPDHNRLLNRIIPGNQSFQEGWYAGMFHFHFWHFGKWQEVIIDDFLPTVGGSLKFVHSSHRTEFWAALMEKAYAKLYGSYEALKGGIMSDSLTDLTGGVAEAFKLRGKKANYPRNIINILFKAMDRGALVGCGIDGTEDNASEAFLPNGLVTGHAYSVTSIKALPVQDGEVILIRVRNPYGNQREWNGPWGDSSSEWRQVHPRERERLGLVRRDDGEFWMNFDDFLANFDSLVICNLTPDAPVAATRKWYTAQYHGRWVKHFNAGGRSYLRDSHWANPQYILKLHDTDDDDDSGCSVIVQLMQKDRRRLKQKGEILRHIGFLIYKVPSGYTFPLKKDFFDQNSVFASCDSFINSRQSVKRFVLPPGVYVVVPCTYEKDKEADFFIRFFFEKGNVSEYADEPPERVEVPPPIPSAKYKEQEEQFQKFFYEMSGEDMEINCFELHKAVNDALRKESLLREIGLDACRSFISLMDVDNSGRLGYTEFLYLWNMLRSWKKTFLQHDADNSGKMDSRELRTALAANGYKMSNQMIAAAIFRYADARGFISLDSFLTLMAKLMKLFNVCTRNT